MSPSLPGKIQDKTFCHFSHNDKFRKKKPPKSWPKFDDFTTAYVVEIEGL
jgi:hypothetical protein